MVITEKTTINEPKPAQGCDSLLTANYVMGEDVGDTAALMIQMEADQQLAVALTEFPIVSTTATNNGDDAPPSMMSTTSSTSSNPPISLDAEEVVLINNPCSPFHNKRMKRTPRSKVGRNGGGGKNYDHYYHLFPDESFEKGVLSQLAMSARRTRLGLACSGKLRYKEQCAIEGTLQCKVCGVTSGDSIGRNGLCSASVLSFDIDGMSPAHKKTDSGASTRIGVAASEIASGISQILCKFCHAEKSAKEPRKEGAAGGGAPKRKR
ncbi:hypothetical protein TrCOL_g8712 [Triparma columacea]|uniref:Uncharacterized protein n=1 Tax=Triparma columacea TaxID=722753 RepID=A0A9W7LCS5_9STRA|nr:hypothetical protein TrCOL_g8712 [Triparma columacea]